LPSSSKPVICGQRLVPVKPSSASHTWSTRASVRISSYAASCAKVNGCFLIAGIGVRGIMVRGGVFSQVRWRIERSRFERGRKKERVRCGWKEATRAGEIKGVEGQCRCGDKVTSVRFSCPVRLPHAISGLRNVSWLEKRRLAAARTCLKLSTS
jgi:hypothetical protein